MQYTLFIRDHNLEKQSTDLRYYYGATRQEALDEYVMELANVTFDDRFSPVAIESLLGMHDLVRIGGRKWDVSFQFLPYHLVDFRTGR